MIFDTNFGWPGFIEFWFFFCFPSELYSFCKFIFLQILNINNPTNNPFWIKPFPKSRLILTFNHSFRVEILIFTHNRPAKRPHRPENIQQRFRQDENNFDREKGCDEPPKRCIGDAPAWTPVHNHHQQNQVYTNYDHYTRQIDSYRQSMFVVTCVSVVPIFIYYTRDQTEPDEASEKREKNVDLGLFLR